MPVGVLIDVGSVFLGGLLGGLPPQAQARVAMSTGMVRSVFAWYSAYGG